MDLTTFHEGELVVQERMGVAEEIGPWARQVVRPVLPEQHRLFYRDLPFVVAAARDSLARPWATILAAKPGFLFSPRPEHLEIGARPVGGDALESALIPGCDLGLLGIELATRRRNRVNGRLADGADSLVLEVEQAFGNCPQYIRERAWEWVGASAKPSPVRKSSVLTASMRSRIERADTFFIATGHRGDGEAASFGMDASHRGGAPGFVRVEGERRLVFPDFAGNNHFNTIGNIVVDDRVGLLFVDFETGGMLQLTGRARIDWDSPAVADHPGARRLVLFDLEEAVELPGALPVRWRAEGSAVRSLRLVEKTRESEDVMSFTFEARDGGSLPDFEPGQHLPVEIEAGGSEGRLDRSYSLSNAPGEGRYRISVKRESRGRASRRLHDDTAVGDFLQARSPAGDFVLLPGARPVVLLSAGVGLTPMLSMLRHLVWQDDARDVVFARVARDGRHDPHRAEIDALAKESPRVASHVFYTRPESADVMGRDFDSAGRPDVEALARLLPSSDVDVYLCGPVPFMTDVQAGLLACGVPDEQIHTESFGS